MGTIEKIVVDDDTLARLQQDARLNGRSLEEEVAERLRQSSPPPTRAEVIARLDAVAAMTPKGVRQSDSTLLIREDRDR